MDELEQLIRDHRSVAALMRMSEIELGQSTQEQTDRAELERKLTEAIELMAQLEAALANQTDGGKPMRYSPSVQIKRLAMLWFIAENSERRAQR